MADIKELESVASNITAVINSSIENEVLSYEINGINIGGLSDIMLIEQALQEKIEREKGCECCRNPRKQWTYLEKSDKYCKNCGRDLRQSKGKN